MKDTNKTIEDVSKNKLHEYANSVRVLMAQSEVSHSFTFTLTLFPLSSSLSLQGGGGEGREEEKREKRERKKHHLWRIVIYYRGEAGGEAEGEEGCSKRKKERKRERGPSEQSHSLCRVKGWKMILASDPCVRETNLHDTLINPFTFISFRCVYVCALFRLFFSHLFSPSVSRLVYAQAALSHIIACSHFNLTFIIILPDGFVTSSTQVDTSKTHKLHSWTFFCAVTSLVAPSLLIRGWL